MLANGLPKIHSTWWLASCSDSSQALRPQESEAEREAAKVEGHHGHVLICLAFISERKHNRKLRLSKPGLHSLPAASIHPLLPRDKRAVQGAAGKIMTHHRCPRPQARTYNYVKLQGKDGLCPSCGTPCQDSIPSTCSMQNYLPPSEKSLVERRLGRNLEIIFISFSYSSPLCT